MAVELFFGNRIESLAKRLSENLSAELIEKKDKFDPAVIIVPNRNMVKWLQLTLCGSQAVLFNVRFDYLENGLWYLLAELDPKRLPLRLMDHKIRTLKLIRHLKSVDLKAPELLPVAGYLLDPRGAKRIDFVPRLWQLAERLSTLFEEYEYHRSEMIAAWQTGKAAETPMERCQRYLYRAVYPRVEQGTAFGGPPVVSLSAYAANVPENKAAPARGPIRTIHVFGMSQISTFHTALLGRLGAFHHIRIYTLNPSQEFWEDLRSIGEKRRLRKQERAPEPDWETPADHPLLAAWGKAGRENVRQLCALTDYTFHECFLRTPGGGRSLLHRLQTSLLTLGGAGLKTADQDRSLQVFAAPSRFREVETVYNTICANLRESAALKLTDIAVLVPDMNLYKPIFDAVFNRNPKALSYNLADSNAHAESLYGRAVVSILDLAKGRFTRRAVFDLLLNPCLMQRWAISTDEIRDWAGWADELNIFHSYSRKDSEKKASVYNERFSWKQALQRLRLGRTMTPFDGDAASMRDFCGVIPFSNLAASNIEVLEKFCVVIQTLHAEVQRLTRFQGGCKEWGRRFTAACDRLIEIPEAHAGEAAVQHALLQELEDLNKLDSDNPDGDPWDIDIFREFILSRLKGISGGQGDYLTSGVTISALQPMRPIPFKNIFILGLEEGQFPGREVVSALDLRLEGRRREDITLPERNCYLFLETLLSAREKLYLSYVARDLQKDRDMQPCSVVNQLIEYLNATLLSDRHAFKIKQIPLKGNDPRYLGPAEITPWSDVMHNFSLADRIAAMRGSRLWAEFLQRASAADMARIKPLAPVLNTSEPPLKGSDARRQVVTTAQLSRFLINPVQQSAQSHLGLYSRDVSIEDLAMKEDEPFFSIFPLDYRIPMACLRLWVDLNFLPVADRPPLELSPEAILQRIYAGYEKQSAAPEGIYGQLDREMLWERISGALQVLSEPLHQIRAAAVRHRAIFWGSAPENGSDLPSAPPPLRFPPLEIDSSCAAAHGGRQQFSAEIHAALNWVWQDAAGAWHALILTGSKKAPAHHFSKYLLSPLLAYAVAQSQQHSHPPTGLFTEGDSIVFHLAYETMLEKFHCTLCRQEARSCLKNLLEVYGNQSEFYWLPFETVLTCKHRPLSPDMQNCHESQRLAFIDELEEKFEEVDDYLIRRLAAPMGPELFDIAHKRFEWILRCAQKQDET